MPRKTAKAGASDAELFRRLDSERKAEIRQRFNWIAGQLVDKIRRKKAGARKRKQLLTTVLQDHRNVLETLSKYHTTDYRVTREAAVGRQKSANKLARDRLRQQKEILRQASREKRYEYVKGNPVVTMCLGQAARLTSDREIAGDGRVLLNPDVVGQTPTRFNNRTTFSASVEARAPGFGFVEFALLQVSSFHEFEIIPQSDGLLQATGFFSPVGSFSLAATGGCFGHGIATAALFARIHLRRVVGDRFGPPLAFTELENFFGRGTAADCEADEQVGIFNFDDNSHTLSLPTSIAVQAGERFFCFAEMMVQMVAAEGAIGQVNLSSAGFGLNVPLVLARLES